MPIGPSSSYVLNDTPLTPCRVLHAARMGKLPVVTRRLDDEERLALRPGSVYAWEERSNNPLEVTGQEIQRFTEGRQHAFPLRTHPNPFE